MLETVSSFFSTKGFMPHGMCLFWKPSVLWTLVISNAWITLSYLLIPIILLHVYLKRKDLKYTWIFLLFAAFILLCGLTHALHVVTYWNPIYGIQGLADAMTAIVSFGTAIVLWRLVPDLLKIPTPKALMISEEKYKTLIESVQHGICTFSNDYRIGFINATGCNILDKSEGQIIGQDIRSIFDLKETKIITDSCDEHHECIIHTQKRQKIIDYHLTPIAILNEDEQFLCSFNDITIFKDISSWDTSSDIIQSAKDTKGRILESQKLESLGQFAGGIAHDFNNTLAVIKGSLEISRELADHHNKDLLYQLQVAEKAVDHSTQFIKQLLMFSRKKSNLLERKCLNVNDVLKNIGELNKTILGSNITLTMQLEDSLWEINADESQLLQIFTNLMTNASYAMKSGGGYISIVTENIVIDKIDSKDKQKINPGSYVRITVSDTGVGISSDNLENIFTPFFSTKPVGEGTGLGLSVIYGIIVNHGGEIFVESEVNKGTKFTLYFPKSSFMVENKSQPGTDPENSNVGLGVDILQDKHILVVDDEEDLREIFSVYLSACGVNTYTAKDGIEALSVFNQIKDQICLIVLDTNMPKLDGISVYQKVREVSSNLPVLFISGNDEGAKLSEITKSDVNTSWLAKPFSKDELLNVSRNMMGR